MGILLPLKILWDLLMSKKLLEFLSRNKKIIFVLTILILTSLYIRHLQSVISSKDLLLQQYETEAQIQKEQISLLEEQARKDNTRTHRTIRQIEREAQNAKPEDNAPFNPALTHTLERLWELDQSRRNQ